MPASYGQSPWARCICGAPVFFCLVGVRHLLCVLVPRPPLRGKLDIIDVRDTPSLIAVSAGPEVGAGHQASQQRWCLLQRF